MIVSLNLSKKEKKMLDNILSTKGSIRTSVHSTHPYHITQDNDYWSISRKDLSPDKVEIYKTEEGYFGKLDHRPTERHAFFDPVLLGLKFDKHGFIDCAFMIY